MNKKIMIIDKITTHRIGLKQIILQANTCIKYEILDFSSGTEAINYSKKMDAKSLDFIFIDVLLEEDIFTLIDYFKKFFPLSKIAVLTTANEYIYSSKLFSLGVVGFISKELRLEEIKTAIEIVFMGKLYFSQDNLSHILSLSNGNNQNPFGKLSANEITVLNLIIAGYSGKSSQIDPLIPA